MKKKIKNFSLTKNFQKFSAVFGPKKILKFFFQNFRLVKSLILQHLTTSCKKNSENLTPGLVIFIIRGYRALRILARLYPIMMKITRPGVKFSEFFLLGLVKCLKTKDFTKLNFWKKNFKIFFWTENGRKFLKLFGPKVIRCFI